jgi:hypothetical protein
MECIGTLPAEIDTGNDFDVSREITTAKDKRIDLMIETPNSILAIENKIFHSLNNDLEEYAAHIRRQDKEKKCYLAVLSIYPQGNAAGRFKNVTYDQFIKAIEAQLDKTTIKIASEYSPLLSDLFKTVKNLKSQNMLDETLRQYLINNNETIDRLLKEKSRFDNDIYSKSQKLKGLFETRSGVKKDVWHKHVVMNHKLFPDGLYLKVDCVIDYRGYLIHVFAQRKGTNSEEILNAIPYFKENSRWNVWLNKEAIPFDTPLHEVADKVNEVLRVVFP